jgi:uncharacterized protein (DUF885 family)
MKPTPTLLSCLAVAFLLVLGCQTLPDPFAQIGADPWADDAATTRPPELARLCREVWQAKLDDDPIQATYLADPRHHAELPRVDPRARQARAQELEAFLRRAHSIDPVPLAEPDRVTWETLVEGLENERARLALDLEAWSVDPVEGVHQRLLNLCSVQPVQSAREREQLVARWRGMDTLIQSGAENLRRGAARGLFASRTAVLKSIAQLDLILATPAMDSPLVEIALGGGRWAELSPERTLHEVATEVYGDSRKARELLLANPHLLEGERLARGTRVLVPADADELTLEERGQLLLAVLHAVEDEVLPALSGLRAVLEREILPRARGDDRPGIGALPGGAAAYRVLIREQTSLSAGECDPEAIHALGLAEVARIRSEMAELGARVFGTRELAEIQRRLREDPAMHFASREEVRGAAEEALFRAQARVADAFGSLPRAACVVVPIPEHEERDTTIAYYREPAPDGSRPGRYFVNTFAPQTRTRYEAEVLAFHEAVPGHHLQIALAQERADLPAFRRHGGSTAFVEGWALYTERLCDELGLYSGDLDRLGMLSFDAWRASRLVVDTGLHAKGWSRAQAIRFMTENTLLAENNVVNEVDRYIAWPAQALAYKLGQREILALRERARSTLGARFRLAEFHDRLLENGAVTLSVLRGAIQRWLARAATAES